MALIPGSDLANTVTDQIGNPADIQSILSKVDVQGAFRNSGNKFTPQEFDKQENGFKTAQEEWDKLRAASITADPGADVSLIDSAKADLQALQDKFATDVNGESDSNSNPGKNVAHPFQDYDSNLPDPFNGGSGGVETKPIKGIKGYSTHVEKKAPQIMASSSGASKVAQTTGAGGVSNPCEFLNLSLGSLMGAFDDLMSDLTDAVNQIVTLISDAVNAAIGFIVGGIKTVISAITDVINDIGTELSNLYNQFTSDLDSLINKVGEEISSLLDQINLSGLSIPAFSLPNLFGDPCAALAFAQMDSPEAQALQDTLKAQQDAGGTAGGSTPDVGTPGVL
jgi:hypothetical protein